MGKRRKGRELLLQACYAARITGAPLSACLTDQLERRRPSPETEAFARRLSERIGAHQQELEKLLASLLENWRPERIGVVEHAILLLALAELRYSPDVPWRVVIDEACELARRFSSEDAVPFINGVLDRAAARLPGLSTLSGGAGECDGATGGPVPPEEDPE
jgi:N utilization substance protein B